MTKKIQISTTSHRTIEDAPINFSSGLMIQRRGSLYLLIGGTFLIGIMIWHIRKTPIIMALLSILALGFMTKIAYQSLIKTKQEIENRKETYTMGQPITGTVIKHRRIPKVYSSSRYFSIDIKPDNTDTIVTIERYLPHIQEQYPVGSSVLGLEYQDHYLFGPMVGVTFIE